MCYSILVNARFFLGTWTGQGAVSRAKPLISRRRAYRDNKIEPNKGANR